MHHATMKASWCRRQPRQGLAWAMLAATHFDSDAWSTATHGLAFFSERRLALGLRNNHSPYIAYLMSYPEPEPQPGLLGH
jgi:hypothetical protein